MGETLKLLKRFALVSLLCLCVTGALCGGAMVDENTRKLALGETGAQVGLRGDQQTVTFFKQTETAAALAEFPSPGPLVRVLRLAPAPLGNLVALGEALVHLTVPSSRISP